MSDSGKSKASVGSMFKTEPEDDLDADLSPKVVTDKGYELGAEIGKGGFSIVYKAVKHDKNGGPDLHLACKLIRFDKVPEQWKETRLKEEFKITRKLDNPYIVRVHDMIKTKRRAFIFMDLAKCSMEDQLQKTFKTGIPEKTAMIWFIQIVKAVQFMHSKGVAHRDLKTENILLDADNRVKLTDFGLACTIMDRDTGEVKLSRSNCGTSEYRAPESFKPPYDARIADN